MSNSHKDDFERMMQLAEFGASRHNERRQVEFRVFIAYTTLLVFALYQKQQIANLNLSIWVIGVVLGCIHIIYFLWEIRLSRAMENDASRRNFYLKKAECIMHHLQKNPNQSFIPRRNVYVMIRLGKEIDEVSECSEKDKISEYELFEKHEPPIELVSPVWHVCKHWGQIFSDWSRLFQVSIPTGLFLLLILALSGNDRNLLKIPYGF